MAEEARQTRRQCEQQMSELEGQMQDLLFFLKTQEKVSPLDGRGRTCILLSGDGARFDGKALFCCMPRVFEFLDACLLTNGRTSLCFRKHFRMSSCFQASMKCNGVGFQLVWHRMPLLFHCL